MSLLIKPLIFTACLLVATGAQAASDRIALVIGVADYQYLPPLENTRNDAVAMADTLEGIGFDVSLALDPGTSDMVQLLEDFTFRSEVADLALVYFAGHGIEVQGENFLIPADAQVASNRDVQRQSLSLKQLLGQWTGPARCGS